MRGAREHNLKNISVSIPRNRAHRHHRPLRLRQVLARLRHHLRRRAAPLRRVAFGVRPAVPRAHGEARRRRHRRALARPSRSSRRPPGRTRARRSAPSPRSTTTSACSGPASACRTAPTTARPVHAAERGADHRHRPRLARGHPDRGARAAGAGPQGRVSRPVRGRAQAGLRPASGGRRDLRSGRGAGAESAAEPRHRGRRGPPGRARRTTASRLNDSIETALKIADGVVEVVRHDGGSVDPVRVMFSERFACPVCGLSLPELEPRQFSFNSPFGACPDCHGLGTRREVNAELILGDPQHLASSRA